jgi:hypothetical protein
MSGHTATPVDGASVWMSAYADAHLQLAAFKKAAGKLAAMARTSGGVAGRDEGLCAACDEVEKLIAGAKQLPSPADSHADLVKALEEIRDHWANQYNHPRKDNEMYRGSYGIGVTDGHRACAIIATEALARLPIPAKQTVK